jgi:hypothetical protein
MLGGTPGRAPEFTRARHFRTVVDCLSKRVLELQVDEGGLDFPLNLPTEECPTCVSGVDPTVQQARFQSSLTGDL